VWRRLVLGRAGPGGGDHVVGVGEMIGRGGSGLLLLAFLLELDAVALAADVAELVIDGVVVAVRGGRGKAHAARIPAGYTRSAVVCHRISFLFASGPPPPPGAGRFVCMGDYDTRRTGAARSVPGWRSPDRLARN